jgi:hypothetical protein
MTIFRWIIGTIAGLLATGAVLSFVIYIAADIDLWLKRARALRRLTWAASLMWFNVEIWGRVVLVIINWS